MVRLVAAVTTQALEQYASAGSVASETLGAIRTVSALNAQPDAISRYRFYILQAMHIGVRKGLSLGAGNGALFLVCLLTYGLGFWYGAQQVADAREKGEEHPTGGDVVTVFFSVTVGSLALGYVSLIAYPRGSIAVKIPA